MDETTTLLTFCKVFLVIGIAGGIGGYIYNIANDRPLKRRMILLGQSKPLSQYLKDRIFGNKNRSDQENQAFENSNLLHNNPLNEVENGLHATIMDRRHRILIGMAGALVITAIVIKMFEFNLEPLLLENQPAAPDMVNYSETQNVKNGSSIYKAIDVMTTWLYLTVLSLLGGYSGIRVVDGASKRLLSELHKQVDQQNKERKETEAKQSQKMTYLEQTNTELIHNLKKSENSLKNLEAEMLLDSATRLYRSGVHDEALKEIEKSLSIRSDAVGFAKKAFVLGDIDNPNYADCINISTEGINKIDSETPTHIKAALYYNRAYYRWLLCKEQNRTFDDICKELFSDFTLALKINYNATRDNLLEDKEIADLRDIKAFRQHFPDIFES